MCDSDDDNSTHCPLIHHLVHSHSGVGHNGAVPYLYSGREVLSRCLDHRRFWQPRLLLVHPRHCREPPVGNPALDCGHFGDFAPKISDPGIEKLSRTMSELGSGGSAPSFRVYTEANRSLVKKELEVECACLPIPSTVCGS
jgi:hypothetical protein